MTGPGPTRVVLVGFMGAGKTTVGRRLAERLGWAFHDVDEAVETETGRSVPELFARDGEPWFRRIEDGIARRLLREARVVVASGGGWGAVPGRLDALGAETVSIWLRVTWSEALARCSGDGRPRPLLASPDARKAGRLLFDERRQHYGRANFGVDTDGLSVEDVTARILEILASTGVHNGSE